MNELIDSFLPLWQEYQALIILIAALSIMLMAWLLIRKPCCCRIKRSDAINVVDVKSLGGRKFLMIVSCGQQKMLWAVEPNGIRYLCPLGNDGKIESK